MKLNINNLTRILVTTIVLILLVALPIQAQGRIGPKKIRIRNAYNSPILVQGTSIVNNMTRRGKPFVVFPGRVGWDAYAGDVRYLIIYDAKRPNIILQRKKLRFPGQEIHLRFVSSPPNPPVLLPDRGP